MSEPLSAETIREWVEDAERYRGYPGADLPRDRILALAAEVERLREALSVAERERDLLRGDARTAKQNEEAASRGERAALVALDAAQARAEQAEAALKALRAKTGTCEGDGEARCFCEGGD